MAQEDQYLQFVNTSEGTGDWYGDGLEDSAAGSQGSFLVDPTTANDSLAGYGNFTYMTGEEGPEPMPIYARVIITIMYSTITLVAVGGNGIVCYIVLAYQKMRTVTNFFIVNLACADLLMAVLCIPFTFIANLLVQYWPFGAIMCPVINYAQVVTVFLSAFTLVAISLDRFSAIICPLRPKMTTKQAAIVIGVIWLLSLAVPLPIAILSQTVTRDYTGKPREHCEESWNDPNNRYIYSLVIMVLQYFLPLFVLTFTYTWIGIVIWVQKTPGEAQNGRDQRMAASKRKMVKMMITVVIIYALCWLPLHIVTLVGDAHSEIWSFRYIQVVWIACHWLAMSNCCYNPMVYCWMNSRFRSGFKYVFRWCPCINLDRANPQAVSSSKMRSMHTFVAKMDLPGNCRNKDKMGRGAAKSAYSPSLRGGIYRGEMYSSMYSQENIAMQTSTPTLAGGSARNQNGVSLRVGSDTAQTRGNFNGYERLALSSNTGDMT